MAYIGNKGTNVKHFDKNEKFDLWKKFFIPHVL